MKFILSEDLDNNPTQEEIEELKDSVKVELVEDAEETIEYDSALIPISANLVKLLDDFILCTEGLSNKNDFLDDFEMDNLKTSLEILKDFNFSYSLFRNSRLREIRRRYEERNKK